MSAIQMVTATPYESPASGENTSDVWGLWIGM